MWFIWHPDFSVCFPTAAALQFLSVSFLSSFPVCDIIPNMLFPTWFRLLLGHFYFSFMFETFIGIVCWFIPNTCLCCLIPLFVNCFPECKTRSQSSAFVIREPRLFYFHISIAILSLLLWSTSLCVFCDSNTIVSVAQVTPNIKLK